MGIVKSWFKPIKFDNQIVARQEGENGTFADTSITNDKDSLGVFLVSRDGLYSLPDQIFEFGQINRIQLCIHNIFELYYWTNIRN